MNTLPSVVVKEEVLEDYEGPKKELDDIENFLSLFDEDDDSSTINQNELHDTFIAPAPQDLSMFEQPSSSASSAYEVIIPVPRPKSFRECEEHEENISPSAHIRRGIDLSLLTAEEITHLPTPVFTDILKKSVDLTTPQKTKIRSIRKKGLARLRRELNDSTTKFYAPNVVSTNTHTTVSHKKTEETLASVIAAAMEHEDNSTTKEASSAKTPRRKFTRDAATLSAYGLNISIDDLTMMDARELGEFVTVNKLNRDQAYELAKIRTRGKRRISRKRAAERFLNMCKEVFAKGKEEE